MRLQVLQYDQKSKESPGRNLKIWEADSSTNTTSEKEPSPIDYTTSWGRQSLLQISGPEKNKSELGMI